MPYTKAWLHRSNLQYNAYAKGLFGHHHIVFNADSFIGLLAGKLKVDHLFEVWENRIICSEWLLCTVWLLAFCELWPNLVVRGYAERDKGRNGFTSAC